MTATQAGKRLRAVGTLLIFFSLGPAALAATKAPTPEIPPVRGPYVVADVDTGRVIEEWDALRPWYPASTTKLMTIYVTFQAIRAGQVSLKSTVLYSANAAKEPPSKMGFRPGTTLALDDALKMMMVKSANDIAVAVAETVGGSVAGFANRMNEAAKTLGMTRTHFVNPNGLPDENNYTTARDMALLARALLTEFPEYRSYFSLPAIEIGGRVLKNFNSLLNRYPGATGMKTGFICAAGYNLVASARRGGREVVVVLFGQYGGKARTERAAELLDEGFAMPAPAADQAFVTLADATSGMAYEAPFDMRQLVCGPKRVRAASEANEEGDDEETAVSHLTEEPLDLGPPIKVSAIVPAVYGEAGFVAPLPRPRPDSPAGAAVLNAYAPGTEISAPAEAIGAAAGKPRPLDDIAPE